jgi:uncharacterized membrane protein YecN with MAPEG domain
MTVTPIYATILGLLFIALSVRTIRMRRKHQVAVGDGDNSELRRAMRVHANFAEYVPLALLLIFFVELDGTPKWWVHALAVALVCGRLAHAWGVSQTRENFRYRVSGMVLTFSVISTAGLTILLTRIF